MSSPPAQHSRGWVLGQNSAFQQAGRIQALELLSAVLVEVVGTGRRFLMRSQSEGMQGCACREEEEEEEVRPCVLAASLLPFLERSQQPPWVSQHWYQSYQHRWSFTCTSVPTVPHLGAFAQAVRVDFPFFLAGWLLDASR